MTLQGKNNMTKALFRGTRLLMIALFLAGCATTQPATPKKTAARLAKAEQLYEQEKYKEAMIECIELARIDPRMAGLPELESSILNAIARERESAAKLRNTVSARRMIVDAEEHRIVPDTYNMHRKVHGETSPLKTEPTPMQKALEKLVTLHLDDVSLDDFILAVGASEKINIISDSLNNAGTMTVHAENVPLSEILDYVSRNLGVAFYIGRSIIWATPQQGNQSAVPMETRMYRLRKGLSFEEVEAGDGQINIVDAVERFIPAADGADLLFNKKAHVLMVKNTRDNLARIEKIIETLDVCPPQVLIEARFITTSIQDLTELGIDWILDSNVTVSEKMKVKPDGGKRWRTQTRINEGGTARFTPFPNAAGGLNLTYQGLLTDPMFTAVIHALDTSGKTRTLSVPRVTTVNNRTASIRIGQDFRYFDEYDIQSTPGRISDAGSTTYDTVLVPVGTPKLEKLGIELSVTPSVGADMGSIDLKILPKITDFVRYETYETSARSSAYQNANANTANTNTNGPATGVIKLPIFSTSELETEVIVRSGETVVMGGLIRTSESKRQEGIPILSWIPLIGRLFRHDTIEETKENLLIFVTATILSERGESLTPIYGAAEPIAER